MVVLDVLRKGGSAVDAAIAANATLGLMEPTGNGIGGDLFAIVWDNESQKLYGLNASGRSPRELTYEKLKAEGKELFGKALPFLESAEKLSPADQNTLASLKQLYALTGDNDGYKRVSDKLKN